MSKTLRVAVLGTASIARKNIAAIFLATDVTVVAVGSRKPEKARAYCEEVALPPDTVCCTYAECLTMPNVDAVYIPLPTTLHLEWVVKAAKAGKHVLCEKPVAVNLTELKTITEACKENNVVLMDGVMFMHHPRLSTLLSMVPPLKPLHVSSAFTFRGDDDFFKNNIRVNGGDPLGCLGDLGWYDIRIALAVFGYKLPTYASGVITEENEHGVPITMTCGLKWGDGRSTNFMCSFRMKTQQWVKIACETAHIDLDDFVIPNNETSAGIKVVKEEFVDEARRCESVSDLVEVENGKPQQTLMWEEFRRRVQEGESNGELSIEILTQLCIEGIMRSTREGGKEVEVRQCL